MPLQIVLVRVYRLSLSGYPDISDNADIRQNRFPLLCVLLLPQLTQSYQWPNCFFDSYLIWILQDFQLCNPDSTFIDSFRFRFLVSQSILDFDSVIDSFTRFSIPIDSRFQSILDSNRFSILILLSIPSIGSRFQSILDSNRFFYGVDSVIGVEESELESGVHCFQSFNLFFPIKKVNSPSLIFFQINFTQSKKNIILLKMCTLQKLKLKKLYFWTLFFFSLQTWNKKTYKTMKNVFAFVLIFQNFDNIFLFSLYKLHQNGLPASRPSKGPYFWTLMSSFFSNKKVRILVTPLFFLSNIFESIFRWKNFKF